MARDDEIRFRLAFDSKQPQQALTGLSKEISNLASNSRKEFNNIMGGLFSQAGGMATGGLREGLGVSALEAYGTSAFGRFVKFGVLGEEQREGLRVMKAEEMAISAVAQRQELLARHGEGDTDAQILQELQRQTELYQRGLKGADRVEHLHAMTQAGYVHNFFSGSAIAKWLGI
jgi:hypothetical protein